MSYVSVGGTRHRLEGTDREVEVVAGPSKKPTVVLVFHTMSKISFSYSIEMTWMRQSKWSHMMQSGDYLLIMRTLRCRQEQLQVKSSGELRSKSFNISFGP